MKPGSLCGDFPVLGAAEQAALQEDGWASGFGAGLGLVTQVPEELVLVYSLITVALS